MKLPYTVKPKLTIEEAIERWGKNKWTWPVEPFEIVGFYKHKTPADIERQKNKRS